MKYYAFYTIHNGEWFFFDNGNGDDTVVVRAESPEEAWDNFMQCLDDAAVEEARKCEIIEFDDPEDFKFPSYVEWDIKKFPDIESEPKKRPW